MKLNFNSVKNDFFKEMKEQGEIAKWQNISKLNIFDYADKFQEYMEKNYSQDDLKDNMSLFKNMSELNFSSSASSASFSMDEDSAEEDNSFIVNCLNDMLKNDSFRNLLDENKDYKIDEEEIKAFLETISGLDDTDEDITISDLTNGINKLKDGELEYTVVRKDDGDSISDETLEQSIPTELYQPASDNSGSIANAGGSSNAAGGSGSYAGSGSSSNGIATGSVNNQISKYNEDGTLNINSATYDDLKQELPSAQGKFEENQESLSAIQNETDPDVAAAKSGVDDCYDAYENTVKAADEDLANKLNKAKTDLDDAQSAKTKQEGLITSQETTLGICEKNVLLASGKLTALQARLGELESNNEEGKYDSKINAIKGEIQAAETAKSQAETARDDAKRKLEEYQKELKEKLEPDVTKAQTNFDEIQEKVNNLEESNPEIKQAKEAWEKAKETFTSTKEGLLGKAQESVEKSKDYINDIQTRMTELETTKVLAANSLKGDSSPIALQEALTEFHTPEWWAQNYGYDIETGELLGESAKEIPYDSELMRTGIVGGSHSLSNCTGGVKHTIADAMIKELGLEGKSVNEYTPEEFDLVYPFGMPSEIKYNSSNSNYSERNFFSPAYQAADVLANNENYREITNFSPSNLTYLPAGAIVVWPNGNGHQYGHISVADGEGHESSDFFSGQMTRYQNSVRVFLPV